MWEAQKLVVLLWRLKGAILWVWKASVVTSCRLLNKIPTNAKTSGRNFVNRLIYNAMISGDFYEIQADSNMIFGAWMFQQILSSSAERKRSRIFSPMLAFWVSFHLSALVRFQVLLEMFAYVSPTLKRSKSLMKTRVSAFPYPPETERFQDDMFTKSSTDTVF